MPSARTNRPGTRAPVAMRTMLALASALSLGAAGCMSQGGDPIDAVGLAQETPLPRRKGTVLVDGCSIDPWQGAILAKPATRVVVTEVLLLCLVPRDTGALGPADPFARKALDRTIDEELGFLQGDGFELGHNLSNASQSRDEL